MAVTDPKEREVRADERMPNGYRFVPKGNVYITKHCRKKTHEAAKTLYVVVGKKNKPIGLRCPAYIYKTVMEQNMATVTRRADAVQKRDAAIEEGFKEALLELFPRIPKTDIPRILKHSLRKHSGRVGRSSTVELEDRVKLAVRAHIRHIHTEYDQLLRRGVSRVDAREKVWDKLDEIARQWGGRPPESAVRGSTRRKSNKKKLRQLSTRKARRNGAVKKAVVHTASRSALARRESRDTQEFPHRLLRGVHNGFAKSGEYPGPNRELNADIDVVDVDAEDVVFTPSEDTSDYDSDCSGWSDGSNWSCIS